MDRIFMALKECKTQINGKHLEYINKKLAPYGGTDGRLFASDVSANFKVT